MKGILCNADLNAIWVNSAQIQTVPEHDWTQHYLGDSEDWGTPRYAALGEEPQELPGDMLTNTGQQLGSHGAQVWQEPGTNDHWLIKHPPPGKDYMAKADVTANAIATHSGVDTPETYLTDVGHGPASAQLMYPGATDAFPGKIDPQSLSEDDLLTIQKHHALDWLLSNHDNHKDNFIRTQDGKLVGIDKGQALKFFNNDRLAWDFRPNEHEPIHNTLYKNMAKGGRMLHDPRDGELGKFIQHLQDTPDDEYKETLRPYAESAAQSRALAPDWTKQTYWNSGATKMIPPRIPPNDVEAFLQAATDRKNNLSNAMGRLYDKAKAYRATGTGVA